jgi:hypothetical protein
MGREVYVRNCEGLAIWFPRAAWRGHQTSTDSRLGNGNLILFLGPAPSYPTLLQTNRGHKLPETTPARLAQN